MDEQEKTVIMQLLDTQPLIKTFSETARQEMLEQGRIRHYAPSETIIAHDQAATFLGVLLEGEATEWETDQLGERRVVRQLMIGDLFGEISVFTGEPARSEVTANRPSRALLIPQETFSKLLATNPRALTLLSKYLATWTMAREKDRQLQSQLADKIQAVEREYGLQLRTGDKALKILVLIAKRNTIEYTLFDTGNETRTARGAVQNIDEGETQLEIRTAQQRKTITLGRSMDHRAAFEAIVAELSDIKDENVCSWTEIDAVGHSVAHGGEEYLEPVLIDDVVIDNVRQYARLAPLHNPHAAQVMEIARECLPNVQHIAVFSNSFHHSLPPSAYLYALPYELYRQERVRRYGFHGPSHRFCMYRAAAHLKRPASTLKMITCHLGEGASVCAIDHGKSIDISSGFTPLEGLPMMTRCGDIDPAIIFYLMREKGMAVDEVEHLLNEESGLKGISMLSGDIEEIRDAANSGNQQAFLAVEILAQRIKKYIGAYFALLGGIDVLVFTGQITERSAGIRGLAIQGLSPLGIVLDEVRNQSAELLPGAVMEISTLDSPVKVLVISSDGARVIAQEVIGALGYQEFKKVKGQPRPIPIEILEPHVQLSAADAATLFGEDYRFTKDKDLRQHSEFICRENLKLVGPRRPLDGVPVMQPFTEQTEVVVTRTQQFQLGVTAPVRLPGDLAESAAVKIEGPVGNIELERGVICARRHIKMAPDDAIGFGVKDQDLVRVRVIGERREVVFGDVLVLVEPRCELTMYLDMDEANAAEVYSGMVGYLQGVESGEPKGEGAAQEGWETEDEAVWR